MAAMTIIDPQRGRGSAYDLVGGESTARPRTGSRTSRSPRSARRPLSAHPEYPRGRRDCRRRRVRRDQLPELATLKDDRRGRIRCPGKPRARGSSTWSPTTVEGLAGYERDGCAGRPKSWPSWISRSTTPPRRTSPQNGLEQGAVEVEKCSRNTPVTRRPRSSRVRSRRRNPRACQGRAGRELEQEKAAEKQIKNCKSFVLRDGIVTPTTPAAGNSPDWIEKARVVQRQKIFSLPNIGKDAGEHQGARVGRCSNQAPASGPDPRRCLRP